MNNLSLLRELNKSLKLLVKVFSPMIDKFKFGRICPNLAQTKSYSKRSMYPVILASTSDAFIDSVSG